jgi:basic amino acid/polyamine antiporter, APA family
MDKDPEIKFPRIPLITAIFIVIANMIGTGVFTILGFQVQALNSVFAIVVLWFIGGIVAFSGALCYGEIGAIYPRCGAEYHYLSKIYHPSIGFLSGFVSVFIGFSAPIALASMALSAYLKPFLTNINESCVAIFVVVCISIVHSFGIRKGSKFQIFFTSLKLLLIISFCCLGFFSVPLQRISLLPSSNDISILFSAPFAVSLIYVSYAYSGWNASAYIASEIKDVKKNLPKSLLLGTLATTILYLLLNIVFMLTAPMGELSGKIEVGFISAGHIFGDFGSRVMSALIGLGLISTISAMVWSGPRVLQVMAEDYPFLKFLAKKTKTEAPARAIFLQLAIVLILIMTSTFEKLITYLGFTLSFFTAAVVLGVIVLRIRQPLIERSFKTWGYPVTPILFLLIQMWAIIFVVKEKPTQSIFGFLTLALGLVIYFLFARNKETNYEA